jgi:hypothetical protein
VCADYWAREEPGAVLQFLHERRQRESAAG